MKTLVLERRHLVGGAAVSEEIFPGYVFSRASYVLSLLRQAVIKEIFPENWRDEVILYRRESPSFTPTLDGRYLLLGVNEETDKQEISKFSRKDALAYKTFERKLEEIVNLFNPLVD